MTAIEMDYWHADVSVYMHVYMYVDAKNEHGPEAKVLVLEYLAPTADVPMDLVLRFVDN